MNARLLILMFVVASPTFAQTNAPPATNAVLQVPLSDIGSRTVILGHLGLPIGEEVTIHGHKPAPVSMAWYNFEVDTLNGEVLKHPVKIVVRGIEKWPTNTLATIRGYEAGDIRFEHNNDGNWGGAADLRFKTHQIIWMNFEGVEVVEPKNLKLGFIGDVGEPTNVKTNR